MPKLFDLRQRGTKEGALTRESGFCFRHLFIFKFFIVTYTFYNLVLLSATHQHESAIGTHMSFPLWASFPSPIPSHPPRLSQSTGLSSLSHTANPHQTSILHMVMHMFPCYSPNLVFLGNQSLVILGSYIHAWVEWVDVKVCDLQGWVIASTIVSTVHSWVSVSGMLTTCQEHSQTTPRRSPYGKRLTLPTNNRRHLPAREWVTWKMDPSAPVKAQMTGGCRSHLSVAH